jgi:UDP-N-acetylmuramoyl-L-alanyl-D-glutamate--2,6-diaminopimelate ligase
MIKKIIKKILPKQVLFFYHRCLAILASFFYNQPSNKLIVIGVTGTAGKSTTVYLIGKMLEKSGWRVGWTSSISFKGANGEIINKEKMTMPGRFFLQRFLTDLVKNNYQAVVIETSSEGILQSRHLGINYDALVFTNLSPEHIEAHGGFENYKKTKAKLFIHLKKQRNKIIGGQEIKKVIIANLDDKHTDYFSSFSADKYYGYGIENKESGIKKKEIQIVKAENVTDSSFTINNLLFHLQLPGKFNIYNALATISVGQWLKITLEQAKKSLESITSIPGRMEEVISQPFKVIVDYAHTPVELENVYQSFPNKKLICLLSSAGGGRDKWKRPMLGKLAAQYCQQIILTDEDPYDENPTTIIKEIETGFSPTASYQIILNRREAIKKVLSLAKPNEIVIITGKGCEPWMCVANGQKIAWDDRKIALEEFNKLSTT